MRPNLSIIIVLLLGCAVVQSQTLPSANSVADKIRIERLADLARIWGAVKHFHPYLAYKELDWDKALIETIPKVNATKSSEEYAAAVNSMLAALGDQQTRATVEREIKTNEAGPTSNANQSPARLENGVLYYDLLAASRITFKEYQRLNDFSAEIKKLFPQAKAIVVDARGLGETRDEILAEFIYELTELLPLMLDQNITLGTTRYRLHNGYATQATISSGGYYSSFVTDAPETFSGNASSKTPPMIFLTDEKTGVEQILSGLQTAKKAFVIADGASSAGGRFYTMKLADNVQVKMRTTEAVNPDGSIGFAPDLTVAKGEASKIAQKLVAENKFVSTRPQMSAAQSAQVSQKDKTYAEMEFPDKEYRLLALFRFWNVINYFYPHKNIIGADWDAILPKYIPRFETNTDAISYRITAQKMVAEIHDSHGSFRAPQLKSAPPDYFPPFGEDYAEGKWFVRVVMDEDSRFKVGDEILEVDGAPVENLVDEWASRIAASTPQALMRVVKNRGIFRGAKDSKVRFKLRGADGQVREIETTRMIVAGDRRHRDYRLAKRQTPIVSVLPSGFGYIDVDRLPASDQEIDKAFETVKTAPALILDMRGYPRGDTTRIVEHLTDKPLAPALFSRPFLDARKPGDPDLIGGATYTFPVGNGNPRTQWKGDVYAGKIVVLINEQTQSAAEGAAGNFAKSRSDLTFIGGPTAGANGDTTYLVLPGDIAVGFTGHNVLRYDGRQLQRVGIQPTVKVAPTIKGITQNKDEVFDAAVEFLRSEKR